MSSLPPALRGAEVEDVDAAIEATVTSGTVVASGLATSEPTSFYARLWDHVRDRDLTDLEIRQSLFLAPHPLVVGDELARRQQGGEGTPTTLGRAIGGLGRLLDHVPAVGDDLARRADEAAGDVDELRHLVDHLEELKDRRIRFRSSFLGPATNTIVPDTAVTRRLAPDWAGRNRARSEVLRYHPAHFPDAAWALSHDPDSGEVDIDLYVMTATPPDADGRLSFGASNGVDGEAVASLLAGARGRLLLLLSDRQPFVDGLEDAPNTVTVDELATLADAGRLVVCRDDAEVPALPPGSFDASEVEETIGGLVADHVEEHLDTTAGRALQVGIGGTGVQAIKRLGEGAWTGRCYTEMLDPHTWALVENGTVRGSHVVGDGGRREIDPLVCTFSLGEEGDGFSDTIDRDDRLRMATARRVLVPEAFHGGLGVNNVLSVDFQGHVNAWGRDHNPWTGVGGSATIMRGLAVGGIAYLCMKSTHRTPEGERRSSIMPFLPQGTPVTLTPPDLMGTRDGARILLVTEQGVAPLHGRDQASFIRSLLAVAHPDFRDELARAAWDEFRVRT